MDATNTNPSRDTVSAIRVVSWGRNDARRARRRSARRLAPTYGGKTPSTGAVQRGRRRTGRGRAGIAVTHAARLGPLAPTTEQVGGRGLLLRRRFFHR
jgi:hypothetical protein